MPRIKNKHLLWAATSSSAVAAALGMAALVGTSRPARDRVPVPVRAAVPIAAPVRSGRTVDTDRRETDRAVADLRRDLAALRAAAEAASSHARKTDLELGSMRSALSDRSRDLRALGDALAPLVSKPWRPDLEPLAERLLRVEKRLDALPTPPRPEAAEPKTHEAKTDKPSPKVH